MKNNFLLCDEAAERLYNGIKALPIIDYHNHLSVADIKAGKRYDNIYDLWIAPDPYKHRAMRMCGVKEELITGSASKKDKFTAWCSVFPLLIGNPLYIWSQVELKDIFDIEMPVNSENADAIYEQANLFLQKEAITPAFFVKKYNVQKLCPCMSLVDDISFINATDTVVPSLRGDNIAAPSLEFIKSLSTFCGDITDFDGFKAAVKQRVHTFGLAGCVFADHAIDNGWRFIPDDGKNGERFKRVLSGNALSKEDKNALSSAILLFLFKCYFQENMTVQLHIGAERFTSTRLRTLAGAAGGFAGIGNSVDVKSLTEFLDCVEGAGLPKTVLFTLNPADSEMLAVLAGSYSADNRPGLITLGPAWWWCDHSYGIKRALESVSAFGVLSNFVGMTTDSRSFLSLVRHDYFRRVLASFVSQKIKDNEIPDDYDIISETLKKICYKNAAELFNIK